MTAAVLICGIAMTAVFGILTGCAYDFAADVQSVYAVLIVAMCVLLSARERKPR